MSTASVTVVIPLFQAETWIEATLRSVMTQSVKPARILVIDDGSTDQGPEKCDRIADTGSVPLIVHSQQNSGQASARNLGLSLAETDFVAFLDSDDIWHPFKLEHQLQYMRDTSKVAATCGYQLWYPEQPARTKSYAFDWTPESTQAWKVGVGVGPALMSTLLIDAETARDLNGFREDMSIFTDLDFSLRLLDSASVGCLLEPLVFYRQHGNQIHRNPALLIKEATFFASKNLNSAETEELLRNLAMLSLYRSLQARDLTAVRTRIREAGPGGLIDLPFFTYKRSLNRRRLTLDASGLGRTV